jgi:Domain of unknown function (DUF1929)
MREPEVRPAWDSAEPRTPDLTEPAPRLAPAAYSQLVEVVNRALAEGHIEAGHAGIIGRIAWVQVALDELDELDVLVDAALSGDPAAIDGLGNRLRDAPSWPLGVERPDPRPQPSPPCPLRPTSPIGIAAAARLIEIFGSEDNSDSWVERALGYYLARAAPLEAVVTGARQVRSRELSQQAFADLFEEADPSTHAGHDVDVPEPPGHAHTPATHEHVGPGIPFPERRWDPCTLDWGYCSGTIGGIAREVLDSGNAPLVVGRVEPPAVCQGFNGTLGLYPPAGQRFPGAQPTLAEGEGFFLTVGSSSYRLEPTPGGWSDSRVTVRFPGGAQAGCGSFSWRGPSAGETLAEAVESRAEQCAGLFPYRPPPADRRPSLLRREARLAVVGAPSIRFTANGQTSLTADGCTDVALAWDVDAGLCFDRPVLPASVTPGMTFPQPSSGPGGRLEITITADGQPIVQYAPMRGRMVANEASTVTYELTARAYAGSSLCGSSTATLTVARTGVISLSAEDRVYYPGRPVPVRIRIGCAAPTGGLQVTLTSSNAQVLPSGSATVAEGDREVEATLGPPPGPSGVVQVTASAPGYAPATITLPVHTSSCIPANFGLDPRRYGGAWQASPPIPGVVGVHMAVLHTGEVLLFNYDEGLGPRGPFASIMRCLTQITPTLAACGAKLTTDKAACDAARDARVASCNATQCTSAAACDAIQCTSFTSCQWWNVPCHIARGACEAGALAARAACHVGRLACEVGKSVCSAAAEVLHIACHAAAYVSVGVCYVNTIAGAAVCALANLVIDTVTGQIFIGGIPASEETASTIANSSRARCAVWNPQTNAVVPVALPRNLFCSGHSFLPDGRLFVAAGQFPVPYLDGQVTATVPPLPTLRGAAHDVHVFTPTTRTWTRLPDMNEGRWYPTVATLDDGKVVVMTGNDAIFAGAGGTQDNLQVFDPMAAATPPSSDRRPTEFFVHGGRVDERELLDQRSHFYHLYPFAHVIDRNLVFVHWKRRTADYMPITNPANWKAAPGTWFWHWQGILGSGDWKYTHSAVSRTGPGPGMSVILPLIPTRDPGTPTYPPARIMIIGGGGLEGEPDPTIPSEEPYQLDRTTAAQASAEILDYSQLDVWRFPTWTAVSPMKHGRVMPDAVLLPDAKVLVVGGSSTGRSGGFLIHFGASWGAVSPVDNPELFDPVTKTWDELCPKQIQRLYHATAALLPDGRVAVAGHDGYLNAPPFTTSQYRIELFSPPYLFRGARPQILAAPTAVGYGAAFTIDVDDALRIASVCLIRQSSITHQTNTDQRYVGLAIVPGTSTQRISLIAPPHGGVAPPGWYMLFAVTRDGIPSVARWVRLA